MPQEDEKYIKTYKLKYLNNVSATCLTKTPFAFRRSTKMQIVVQTETIFM